MQNFDGSFPLSDSLASLIGVTVAHIKTALSQCITGIKSTGNFEQVYATAIVVAFLEVYCGSFQDEWELVAMKAERWLAEQFHSRTNSDSLLAAAKKVIATV